MMVISPAFPPSPPAPPFPPSAAIASFPITSIVFVTFVDELLLTILSMIDVELEIPKREKNSILSVTN